MFNIYKTLFFITMMSGTFIAITSNSWMGTWIGLEINLLSIIPMMNNLKMAQSTEASLKYFITQAMASMILLMGMLIDTIESDLPNNIMSSNLPNLYMQTALMIKMGAAPFHFWFPEVMEGLNWFNALLILTWQKIAPMTVIMYTTKNENFMNLVILTSVLVGGLMGINQTSLRKVLSYSSINQIGWMLAALMFSESIWVWYFLIYSMMNTLMIWMLSNLNISKISQLMVMTKINPQMKLFFMFNFFSLGGIPPFVGFLPKWLTIQTMIINQLYITALMMIVMTLITLYFYMRIAIPPISFSALMPSTITMNFKLKNKQLTIMNSTLLMSLILSTMTFNWI